METASQVSQGSSASSVCVTLGKPMDLRCLHSLRYTRETERLSFPEHPLCATTVSTQRGFVRMKWHSFQRCLDGA